ncbi:unnamed protein product, partial [Rotaria sordida]
MNKQTIDTSSSDQQYNQIIVNTSEALLIDNSTIDDSERETQPLLDEYK